MPDGDDDYETPGNPDDDDNDSGVNRIRDLIVMPPDFERRPDSFLKQRASVQKEPRRLVGREPLWLPFGDPNPDAGGCGHSTP